MGACQVASQMCDFRPESAHRHGSRRVTRALGHSRQHQWLNHWRPPGAQVLSEPTHVSAYRRTASVDNRPEPPDQAVNRFAIADARCDSHF